MVREPRSTVLTRLGGRGRVGEVSCCSLDFLHESIHLGSRVEADVVLLEDPLDPGPALRLPGAELAHEDELELTETGVRVLVEGFAFNGVAASGVLGVTGVRRLEPGQL